MTELHKEAKANYNTMAKCAKQMKTFIEQSIDNPPTADAKTKMDRTLSDMKANNTEFKRTLQVMASLLTKINTKKEAEVPGQEAREAQHQEDTE